MDVSFSVSGWVRQEVEIIDPAWNDAGKLQKALTDGTVVTTIQEDGTIDITLIGHQIGRIKFLDNECTYDDFEVEMTEVETP